MDVVNTMDNLPRVGQELAEEVKLEHFEWLV